LKRHLHVDALLGGRFVVGYIVLRLAPLLRSTRGHLAVVQIHLIAQHNEGEVIGIPWTGLYEELVAPGVEILERVGRRHIVDKHAAVGSAVKRHSKRLEAFLTSSVPDLLLKFCELCH